MLLHSKLGSHFLNIIFSLYNFSVSWFGKDWQKSGVERALVKISRGLSLISSFNLGCYICQMIKIWIYKFPFFIMILDVSVTGSQVPSLRPKNMDMSGPGWWMVVAVSLLALAGWPRCFLGELILKDEEVRLQEPYMKQSLSWEKNGYFECKPESIIIYLLTLCLSSMES